MEDLVMDTETRPVRSEPVREVPRKVLLTGADGYIGSVMGPRLVEQGFEVTGVDVGLYRAGWLFHDGKDRPPILMRDVRDLKPQDLRGYDAVVHLAELSNDPLGEHDQGLTYAINHEASVSLAKAAKAAGVRRFVYASSCSVYGAAADEEPRTELSPTNPQTAYARCKVMVERDVSALADADFSPTFLRLSTAFGASPRMRFDVVLNNLAGLAWTTGKIAMSSDGTPWRPLVHISDISDAFIAALKAPSNAVHNQIINVGTEANNYRIREIAETAAKVFPGCEISFGDNGADNRSYRVSFAKLGQCLPDFRCQWTAEKGFWQLRAVFERIAMTDAVFNAPPFTRLKQLRQLLETGQFDANLRYKPYEIH